MQNSSNNLIPHLTQIYDNCPFIVTYKEPENLGIIYCNNMMLKFVDYKNLNTIFEKNDYDFEWESFAPIYEEHERAAISNHLYPAIFPGCDYLGNKKLFMCHRTPFFNQEKVIEGVLTHTYILDRKDFLHLGEGALDLSNQDDSNLSYSINKKLSDVTLSAREHECLFYLLHGKTYKMVAKILNISPRTIEQYIDNVKNKFNCLTKSELISKAISQGYLHDIPMSLISKRFQIA